MTEHSQSGVLSSDEQSRWKLIPERVAELRRQVDGLLSAHNIYECVALRDILSEELARFESSSVRRETGATVEGEAPENRTPCGPIPMLLWCPACGERHIDVNEFATKVHHTHACQSCGMVWRPAVIATVGVQYLPGFKND
jgi:hypothetical protein